MLGAAGLQHVLESRVAELEAADPMIVSLAMGLVVLVTLGTCLLAARRATAVEAVSVLRAE